ncbi:hypothetical protein C7T86_15915 [Xanthomonas citri pv. malvacearum]|uniref:Uncharacterized protein n=1 Tax=Xanthomonas campestris pv. malvacearum TaxID=86040 RepID=A0AA45BVJ1_XANCM|nr:hypothetical protein CIW71_17140 [Xanthomonas citri pv. malvacearum]ASY89661.1 hypothetical protein CIW72_16100 [Xanthomonas citri pv. malvacearum]NMI15021.1 hypothetical protein [Xanthomonas citri]PUE91953.1 hypothetical protein C7T86_15915 [Xanthomonas citri pv. malvacearum]
MFRSRDPTGGQRRLAVLRVANRTPALTARRAQPLFGIGMRHSYTALVGAPSASTWRPPACVASATPRSIR